MSSMEPTMTGMMRNWFVALAVGSLAAAGCQGGPSDASPKPEAAEVAPIPVEVLTVEPGDFTEAVDILGTAEPRETVRVSPEAPGKIVAAPFEEGQEVRRGEVLYRIDNELDAAQIDLLKTQVATARRELERTQRLAKEGLATPQQLDQAETALESAELSLRQAQVGLSKTVVHSPLSGVVLHKFAEPGEYAAPGAPLAEIVVYDPLVVRAQVPESLISYVGPGAELTVEFPGQGRTVVGTVKRRAIMANQPTRTFPVEIHVPNEDRELLPGMRARIAISKKVWEGVVVVPREAILEGFNGREAMVVTGDGALGSSELRQVRLGPGERDRVVVLEGLEPGDRLITRGHRSLVSGTRVEVVNRQAPADEAPAGEAQAGETQAGETQAGETSAAAPPATADKDEQPSESAN